MILLAANILNWRGPEFLKCYCILLVITLVVFLIAILWLCWLDTPAEVSPDELDAYDTAYLVGGHKRLTEATLASLYRRGCVASGMGHRLQAAESPPIEAASIEHDLYAAVAARGELRDIRQAAAYAAKPMRKRLIAQRLLHSARRRVEFMLIGLGISTPLLGLGAAKIAVGLDRGKPVLFLVLLMLLSVGLTFLIARSIRRTRAGRQMLYQLRDKHASDMGQDEYDATAIAWTCGLFGSAVVTKDALAGLRTFLASPTHSRGGDSGCSGSGCGGGCGGCGG